LTELLNIRNRNVKKMNPNSETLRSLRNILTRSDLPMLTGAPGEIEDAMRIRVDQLLAANGLLAQLHQRVRLGEVPRSELDEALLALRRLREPSQAQWWVAHQNCGIASLLQELAQRSYGMEYGRN
jgi:hypothetical protein